MPRGSRGPLASGCQAVHSLPMAVRLEPYTEADFEAWLAEAVPAYALDHVVDGTWSPAHALELSREAHAGLLPQGVATPGHAFLRILAEGHDEAVGFLWWAETESAGEPGAYVYGLGIHEEARRRGYGTAALAELERIARARGLRYVCLHVFGHNAQARRLYEQIGFSPTNITLRKNLS